MSINHKFPDAFEKNYPMVNPQGVGPDVELECLPDLENDLVFDEAYYSEQISLLFTQHLKKTHTIVEKLEGQGLSFHQFHQHYYSLNKSKSAANIQRISKLYYRPIKTLSTSKINGGSIYRKHVLGLHRSNISLISFYNNLLNIIINIRQLIFQDIITYRRIDKFRTKNAISYSRHIKSIHTQASIEAHKYERNLQELSTQIFCCIESNSNSVEPKIVRSALDTTILLISDALHSSKDIIYIRSYLSAKIDFYDRINDLKSILVIKFLKRLIRSRKLLKKSHLDFLIEEID